MTNISTSSSSNKTAEINFNNFQKEGEKTVFQNVTIAGKEFGLQISISALIFSWYWMK